MLNPDFDMQLQKTLTEKRGKLVSVLTKEVNNNPFRLYGSKDMFLNLFFPDECFIKSYQDKLAESDWDFVLEKNEVLENQLFISGWELKPTDYEGSDVTNIYEKELLGEKIQLSFRENSMRFIVCWRKIRPEFYFDLLWKHSPTYIGKENVTKYLLTLYDVYEQAKSQFEVDKKVNLHQDEVKIGQNQFINLGQAF